MARKRISRKCRYPENTGSVGRLPNAADGAGGGPTGLPFFMEGAAMIDADLHLWRAVLVHGLEDAARAKTPRDAAWLGSRDFAVVCHLAQVEPEAVLRAYRPERFQVVPHRARAKRIAA